MLISMITLTIIATFLRRWFSILLVLYFFDLILVSSIVEAKRRIFEDEEIDLILCDLELPDGTAMELFHTLRRVAGMFQMKNPPVRLLPFFILTENNDLATEYEYRHEGVNDYITAPVNIPELIRRVLFFVE